MNKVLYKLTLGAIKILPMLIALGYLINTILSYIGIEAPVLSYLCGLSLFPLIFMYLVSYMFKFCEYHRMFLHYIVITDLINIYDNYIGVPLSDMKLFMLHMSIACIVLFIILYIHSRELKRETNIG